MHPHIHALLLVPARYFAADYIRQSRWREMWMESARLDYAPVVDVRTGYSKEREDAPQRQSVAAAIEAAKYISKASDMAQLGPALVDLEAEIKGARMVSVSGPLAEYVRAEPLTDDQLLDPELAEIEDSPVSRYIAQWDEDARRYELTT
jgi:hypothetical protein